MDQIGVSLQKSASGNVSLELQRGKAKPIKVAMTSAEFQLLMQLLNTMNRSDTFSVSVNVG